MKTNLIDNATQSLVYLAVNSGERDALTESTDIQTHLETLHSLGIERGVATRGYVRAAIAMEIYCHLREYAFTFVDNTPEEIIEELTKNIFDY